MLQVRHSFEAWCYCAFIVFCLGCLHNIIVTDQSHIGMHSVDVIILVSNIGYKMLYATSGMTIRMHERNIGCRSFVVGLVFMIHEQDPTHESSHFGQSVLFSYLDVDFSLKCRVV